ncbi:MAG: glycosyltransferase family 2 protein [Armatimonadota bacterium]
MLVSTIITTYKRPTHKYDEWLARSVQSVLSQEFSGELEVIVVNDNGEQLKYAPWQEDPRVTVITTQKVGPCFARNTGASLSRGDYLHFLDDDMMLPEAYAALVHAAETTGGAWVHGWYECMDDEGNLLYTLKPVRRGKLFAVAVAGCNIPLQVSLVSREAFFDVGGIDARFPASEDFQFFLKVTMRYTVEPVQQVVARIRVGRQGATTANWALCEDMCRIARDLASADPRCVGCIFESLREMREEGIRGKLVRYYLGSAWRHLRNYSILTALSRAGIVVRLSLFGLPRTIFFKELFGVGKQMEDT